MFLLIFLKIQKYIYSSCHVLKNNHELSKITLKSSEIIYEVSIDDLRPYIDGKKKMKIKGVDVTP